MNVMVLILRRTGVPFLGLKSYHVIMYCKFHVMIMAEHYVMVNLVRV